MTYEQALAFWYGCINYEQVPPCPDDLKLDRIRSLLQALGDPHESLRIVHVAGSKGKGSTSAMLAAIFGRAGHRTGLFTSPHLSQVEERIQVDGVPITSEELTSLLEEVQEVIGAGGRGVILLRCPLPTALLPLFLRWRPPWGSCTSPGARWISP
jgi:dihydrofolate synthase/folylpolyglutamate synthase